MSPLFCLAIDCPGGMVYQQCRQSCPQRCDIDETVDCIGGCADGCFCPRGQVLQNGTCTSCTTIIPGKNNFSIYSFNAVNWKSIS